MLKLNHYNFFTQQKVCGGNAMPDQDYQEDSLIHWFGPSLEKQLRIPKNSAN